MLVVSYHIGLERGLMNMPKIYCIFREHTIKQIDICCRTFETLLRIDKWGVSSDKTFSDTNRGDGDGMVRKFYTVDSKMMKRLKYCYGCSEEIEFILIGNPPSPSAPPQQQ